MTDYPYANIQSNLEKFISGIPRRGVPDLVDRNHLKQSGFTSGNDVPILSVLEFIGFIDKQGKPTSNYSDFRIAAKQEETMTRCLKVAYSDLFKIYSDAHIRTKQELTDFFTAATTSGELVVIRTVATFLTLCKFSEMKPPKKGPKPKKKVTPKKGFVRKAQRARTSEQAEDHLHVESLRQPQVVVNIQIVIPESKDPSLYEELFKSLKKHLFE